MVPAKAGQTHLERQVLPCPRGLAAHLVSFMQVFKGIKNGVQEVAVKVLINSDEIQVQMFQEVIVASRFRYTAQQELMSPGTTVMSCCFVNVTHASPTVKAVELYLVPWAFETHKCTRCLCQTVLVASQEIRLLRSVSFDRNIVQFCGACLQPTDTMMILEYMAVSHHH